MAGDVSRSIELIFGAVDQTSSVLSSMGSNFESFDRQVSAVAEPIASFTESLLKIEGAVALAGGALAGFALKQAVDFQSATIDLQKVLKGQTPAVVQFSLYPGRFLPEKNRYVELPKGYRFSRGRSLKVSSPSSCPT